MRIPDPKANTTTEAYLAYKAGYLEESELKPSLYEPYLHFDAWLAYWAGLNDNYPLKGLGKNLFNFKQFYDNRDDFTVNDGAISVTENSINYTGHTSTSSQWYPAHLPENKNIYGMTNLEPNTTYTISYKAITNSQCWVFFYNKSNHRTQVQQLYTETNVAMTFTTPSDLSWYAVRIDNRAAASNSITDIQIEQGSSASPYEPYTGEPEMLTDEEALVAYLSGVTDTYPEEIKDPYDVRIVGYLRHLASIRWPEPDYPVNNEEFYLSTMEPTHTSNPVPSSDIELDTAEGNIIGVEAYGDTYQQTYSGKNLYDMSVDNRVSWSDTLTEDENGWITATGYNGFYNFWTKPNMNLVPGATYYYVLEVKEVYAANASDHIMVCNGTATASASKPQFVDDADLKYTDLQAGGIYIGSITASSDFSNANNMLRSWCRPYNASSKLVFRLTIMSNQPSASTFVYEPYVGGIPAPNPDYPQAVQVVTGEQTVTVTGKNLFDKSAIALGKNWNGEVGTVCYPYQTQATRAVVLVPAKPNTTYNLSLLESDWYVMQVVEADSSYEVLSVYSGQFNQGTKEVTTSATTAYIGIKFKYGSAGTTAMVESLLSELKLQLEQGSATAYEPYQSQSYAIDLTGKNLLDITTFENGYINSSGTVSGGGGTNAVFGFMPVLPETDYTVSVQNNSFAMAIAYYDSNKTLISRVTNDYVARTSRTFTTPQNCAYARAGFYAGSGAGQSVMESSLPQFEKGSSASSYAPYYNYELCKIGTYQDYIYKSGDDWYVHKATQKEIYDGVGESWQLSTSDITMRIALNPAPVRGSATNNPIIANQYVSRFSASINNSIFISGGADLLGIKDNVNATSYQDWGAWLASNNLIVYYAIATPTDTKITDATLVGQLDALAGADTYNEKTYIKVTATDPNLPALLKVEAYKY